MKPAPAFVSEGGHRFWLLSEVTADGPFERIKWRDEVSPSPDSPLELIGTGKAAKLLGMSASGLRWRITSNVGQIKPIGLQRDPEKWLWSKAEVLAEAQRVKKRDTQK